ncbi:MAG: alpha-amylase family glycosyl hydrolase [Lacibacter sp.]
MKQPLFHPPAWALSTNIYEVNLRQYTREGTFRAFEKHLPRLYEMGVEVLWFMPITPIARQNRKGTLGSYYACSSYVQTNPEFGTLADFQHLVDAAHRWGMKVIIDWVANHTGWDHEWTEAHPEFYSRNADGSFRPPVENWEDVIQLNYENADMRRAMTDAMRFWVEQCDIDGFRCDMAMLVPLDFWMEARSELDRIRPLFWLGEFDQWGADAPYAFAFDASYTWHWMHVTEEFYKGVRRIPLLDQVLAAYHQKAPYGHMRTFFTTNHDENSWNGTEYEKYGNMAMPLAVFSCLWNGIPLLYSGQELPNKKRLAFFDKDEIEWGTKEPRLHQFFRQLLHLRKAHPALHCGDRSVLTWRIATNYNDRVFSFIRRKGSREVVVALNFSEQPLEVQFTDTRFGGLFTDLFTNAAFSLDEPFTLPPWGYRVGSK